MRIELLNGLDAAGIVEPHYCRNDFSHVKIQPEEILFIATDGLPNVFGCVRFCIEDGVSLLRSMAVDATFRGQGIGTALLMRFREYLESNQVGSVHLVCSQRLNSYYEKIDFVKMEFSAAPRFLQERMRRQDPELVKMNCMVRR
jgi:N-acetylglutamate synthase-like GNAT family acetyltransferase